MAVSDRAVFLDKDGTLVRNVPYNVDPKRISLTHGALEGLRALGNEGYRLFVVSNYCPHHPEAGCGCRKPASGLLRRAACEHALSLEGSWMVGDILDDVEAGCVAGCRTVLLDVGNETEWHLHPGRFPDAIATDLREAATLILAAGPREPSELTVEGR